jgi:redox-sensitive bicupin YhaK (pirin superfamily)
LKFSAGLPQQAVMKIELHPEYTRGTADHGWLKTAYSFSFSSCYNPARIHFGALRVLNDDYVAGGMGFGKHPHDNMEIVTIPLKGALAHEDSTGNKGIIQEGDVQIMSAGSGISHSEFNANPNEAVELFQIWVMPRLKNITPRYDQRTFEPSDFIGQWKTVVSPLGSDIDSLHVNQDTYFNLTVLENGESIKYFLHGPQQGAFLIVIEGALEVANNSLGKRDAIGISETDHIEIKACSSKTKALLIEIPMIW